MNITKNTYKVNKKEINPLELATNIQFVTSFQPSPLNPDKKKTSFVAGGKFSLKRTRRQYKLDDMIFEYTVSTIHRQSQVKHKKNPFEPATTPIARQKNNLNRQSFKEQGRTQTFKRSLSSFECFLYSSSSPSYILKNNLLSLDIIFLIANAIYCNASSAIPIVSSASHTAWSRSLKSSTSFSSPSYLLNIGSKTFRPFFNPCNACTDARKTFINKIFTSFVSDEKDKRVFCSKKSLKCFSENLNISMSTLCGLKELINLVSKSNNFNPRLRLLILSSSSLISKSIKKLQFKKECIGEIC